MRVLVHDFAGHPFQVDLSRELAQRGHVVHHVYCGSLRTTPQGALERHPRDPETFFPQGLAVPRYDREQLGARWRGDRFYGRQLAHLTQQIQPDVVLSANTPLDAQAALQRSAYSAGAGFVYWLQDMIGEASYRLLSRRLPAVGPLIGRYYQRLEWSLLRASGAVVQITEDFRPLLRAAGIPDARLHTVENWAPLADLPVKPQDNPWSRKHGLVGKRVLMYAGTLGMKHNPELLLALGRRFHSTADVRVVVCSQGRGADWLRTQAEREHLPNVKVIGFQPFESLADMLGSATVLTAILEPDAGVFSVPSKVLSYLCAGRALLLAVPPENLAARLVLREQAGQVVLPNSPHAFADAAALLLDNATRRDDAAGRARRYAEQAFALDPIVDTFETLLASVSGTS